MKLDPFYLIVDSASWISRLVPLGVKLVQLRIKDADGDLLRSQIAWSKAICAEYGCQLIVNDHWKLAIETGCDFVHLGQEDLAIADINAIRNAGLRLGVSTHDGAELDTALAVEPDYIALGPVFSTTTKELKWAPQGLEKISGWKQQIGGLPLVAIGGISLERLPGIFENGADSAAVISDITNSQDPETRVGDWISATASWRN
ncbi:thiamine phosphate synthase [Roseibium porphyridii]|uniref:Thiamine-phosphate synthase n=1 Tax=Roseibium porphyridii TaxID=2866279 RepID=A0ABY8EXX6_9HYPH|nr:thiamine phosphate synthase [Roseibium sp. KMA01]WFE87928.1 thiamine phosphate synthase [Roseibium sp. KMA01]